MKQATKTVSTLKYDLFGAIGHQECITQAKFLEVLDVGELLKKSVVTVPKFAICIKSRSKNERSV
ncbi:hypothetical protein QUB56_09415 [Microcoleus sp. AR_TQ3_B6]|uniref:hypothetical protein n=1 Tax=Microcoleus sp. AR_TQ3_B6 TaxID=3055284 RepID=UPI002FD39ED8